MISLPVYAVYDWVVELILHLTPSMVEHIGTFFSRPIIKFSHKGNILALGPIKVNLLNTSARRQISLLAILVDIKGASSHTFYYNLGRTLLKVMLPQVISAFKSSAIIQLIALDRQPRITEMRRVAGKSHDSVTTVGKVKDKVFLFIGLIILILIFFIAFLLFLLDGIILTVIFFILGFFLQFLDKCKILFTHKESVPSVAVKEHDIYVILRPPTAMTAISGTVR